MKNYRYSYIALCASYLLYYISLGAFSPFLNIYYERIGLSGSQIGFITSAGYIVAMLFSPVWGAITDKNHKYKSMIAFLSLTTTLLTILWKQQTFFLFIFIFSLLLNIFRSNIGNLLDALAIQSCKENNKEFSFVRAMGSLGYLIASFGIGNFLFEKFQLQGPYIQILAIGNVLLVLCLLFIKPISHQKSETVKEEGNFLELFKNKDYVFILFLCFFTIIVNDSTINYLGNHLVSTLQLPDSAIGLNTCAMVLPEVFIIMNIHKMIRKIGLKKSFMIAIITQILRCILYATSTSLPIFMIGSLVHGLMIGVGTVGVVDYIHKKIPSHMMARAMTVYGGFTVISYAIQAQAYGFVYQMFGSHMIFIITLVCTAIALLMTLKTKRLD
ncbi:MAG: MFS transporter [Erysipelotrichaceae bacterium]|nr:MFS transporter [Erysipelotrichaceae bacterium]MBR5795526.1 MFS transporter [Erysipelotrichaceae bacterium]